jgi:hypothetical protein
MKPVKKVEVREVEAEPELPKPEAPASAVDFKSIAREARKEQVGADYFLSELEGKEVIIIKVDMNNNIAEALVDGQKVKVTWRGAVATKKMALIDRWIRTRGQAVKVSVVRRTSKSGRSYIDLV